MAVLTITHVLVHSGVIWRDSVSTHFLANPLGTRLIRLLKPIKSTVQNKMSSAAEMSTNNIITVTMEELTEEERVAYLVIEEHVRN